MIKKYDSYKDSGVEWLGEIPEHWELILVKRFSKTLAGGTPSTDKLEYWDGDIPWLPSGKLQNCDIEKAEKFITKLGLKKSATKLIRPNTTLIALTGATCANIGYLKFKATANQSVVAIENDESISSSRYVFYALINERQRILLNQTGGAQAGINENDVKNIEIVFPPLQEQTAIAQFLDDKTQKIDQAIGIKKQQIALLKERKQILIHKAVTGQLIIENGKWIRTPKEKMKDSGVQWIGEIPEHWEVKKVTHLFDEIGSGTTPTAGDIRYYDGEYNFLQTGDLNDDKIIFTKRSLKERAFKVFTSLKLYPKGSLVMAMYGATIGKLGILDIESATNQACCVFGATNKIEMEYFFQILWAFRPQIISFGYGGGQPNISQDLIKSLRFPVAPLSEQKEITEHIGSASQKIDTAISLKTQEIEKLKEYKSSLINSVVTGKVKIIEN